MVTPVENRTLGRTGREVGVIGLGCWQLGADWGHVEERDALAILDAAVNAGASFFDTADVYGDGRSEQTEPEDRLGPSRVQSHRPHLEGLQPGDGIGDRLADLGLSPTRHRGGLVAHRRA